MEITQKQIDAAYKVATDEQKQVLDARFKPADDRPITERIKTFTDAVEALGNAHEYVKEWREAGSKVQSKDLRAYYKLRIIAAALNEGWLPIFEQDEKRWYVWYWLYSKEEVDRMPDENSTRVLAFGGSANSGAYAGLANADAYHGLASAYAFCGSRLCYITKELAEYAGRQFANIYADFLL